jgi:hypothetical protein
MGMMQQPMMPQQPMPMEAQPLPQMMPQQPMMQDPAYMPPQVPGSVQPQALRAGGLADAEGREAYAERFRKSPDPVLTQTPEEAIDADVLDKAVDLMPALGKNTPEEVATEILDTASTKGAELTGDMQVDLARIYQNLTGDPAAFEKNIDNLNRGIIGAAIGAGTSARATENISQGLLIGLQGSKDTEERRLGDARALQLAEIQARTAEANKRAGGVDGAASRDYRNPVDAFQDAYQTVMKAGEYDAAIPEGMTREQYAEQVATALIQRSYTSEQLVGSPFEGMSVTAGATPPPGAGAPPMDDEAYLSEARKAVEAGNLTREEAIQRLESIGVDASTL